MLNQISTVMALALFLIGHLSSAKPRVAAMTGQNLVHRHCCQYKAFDATKAESIALDMQVAAPFSKGKGWRLTVDGSGSAHLTINSYPKRRTRTFKISAKQLAQFQSALAEQQFFALGAEYGGKVPDGSTRVLSITEGKQSRSVILRYLSSNAYNPSEVKRAVRIWNLAQSWFNDADAMDLRPYDRRILDAK